jgi:hypothetical protein
MIDIIIHTRPRGWQGEKEVGREEEGCVKTCFPLACRRCSPPPRTTLPGMAEWKTSGIPSAGIIRSQYFSQFQLPFSAKPRWVPALPVRSRDSMPALGVDVDGQKKRITDETVKVCAYNFSESAFL